MNRDKSRVEKHSDRQLMLLTILSGIFIFAAALATINFEFLIRN